MDINRTKTIKNVVTKQWKKFNVLADYLSIRNIVSNHKKASFTEMWDELNEKYVKDVMWNYYSERFPTPDLMMDARVKFMQSYSAWCIVGYIIGLGDRHCDNILLHFDTGEASHVDFDCIFEKGRFLPVPELVPFRLTRNIIDLFGVLGEKGTFQKTCELVLKVLQENKRNVLGFLSSFVHDPIIERTGIKITPENALKVINDKLTGVDNFTDRNITPEEQVEKIINQAKYEEYLKNMFFGWMPWM